MTVFEDIITKYCTMSVAQLSKQYLQESKTVKEEAHKKTSQNWQKRSTEGYVMGFSKDYG